MNSKYIYIASISLLTVFGCNDTKKNNMGISNEEMEVLSDNSMTSLDWEGTYEGILPCGDCDGIKTIISINKDNTYVTKEIYEGKSDSAFETKGTFKWDDKGQKITLSNSKRHPYFVGENMLIHLDKDGNKITGDLEKQYVLKKVNDQLVGKKWHLASFKGEEIQLKEAKAEHPFMEFKDDFTMIGYTGCNNLQGVYTLGDAQKISFSQLINTQKFCPEMETENEFLNVMGKANYYAFEDHALVIFDTDHTLLATFKPAN